MLYLLRDKYYNEGYYDTYHNLCGFTSAEKAKAIESCLASYLHKYDDEIKTPMDYFSILREHSNEILEQFSKILGSKIEARKLYNKLPIQREYMEFYSKWKNDGNWFTTIEISEF